LTSQLRKVLSSELPILIISLLAITISNNGRIQTDTTGYLEVRGQPN
jgi:hypothetical protein